MSEVKKEKELIMPVSIECQFKTMEQKLLFEAVVLPDIRAVLSVYAPVLGYVGLKENIEKMESEEK